MRNISYKTYEFTIEEVRSYTILANGSSKFEAEQEAIERFHRLNKSKDLVADKVSKPRIVKGFQHK